MPDIDAALFRGSGSIPPQDAANCEVNNIGEAITTVLANYGWNGEPAGCILLQLSADHERVAAGTFLTRGSEEKEFVLDASKIWQDANMGVTLTVRLPELDSFVFNDGGLTSDFLPDEEMVHFFHAAQEGGAARPILTADLAGLGIGKFCLRLVCQLSKASAPGRGAVVRYAVMMFPASKAEMLQLSPHARSGSWPGMKLGEGELAMLPTLSAEWGCPLIPLLRPATSFATLPRAPSATALKHAISAIMRRGGAPDGSRNATSLAAKWEKARRNPASFVEKEPSLTWPTHAEEEPSSGE